MEHPPEEEIVLLGATHEFAVEDRLHPVEESPFHERFVRAGEEAEPP